MADRRQVLVIIPARGGSKRLPRKNVLPLAGKPLIAWTIEAAVASEIADTVLVSSDDDEILAVAQRYGAVPMLRPARLADDTAKTVDVVVDAVSREAKRGRVYDDVILLQPTSPLRNDRDIQDAYAAYLSHPGETVVSVCELDHPLQWCGKVDEQGVLTGIDFSSAARSQDLTPTYRLNGAIYIFSAAWLLSEGGFYTRKTNAYVMPRERSADIDTELDFSICAAVLNMGEKNA